MRRSAASFVFLLTLLMAPHALAVPAAPIEVELTQPNGHTFTAIPRGDEYAQWMETRDGHSIVQRDGAWYYAEPAIDGTLQPSPWTVGSLDPAALEALPKHLAPTPDDRFHESRYPRRVIQPSAVGSAQAAAIALPHAQPVLTILVDYADTTFTYSDASFGQLMYTSVPGVRDFFLENSYDQFDMQPASESFDTADDGIVHVGRAVNHPNQGQNLSVSRAEAVEIITLADPYVDFASYDADNNDLLTPDELSIIIIVAGYESSYGGLANAPLPNVWGHVSGSSIFGLDVAVDGKDVQYYAMFGETHAITQNLPGAHQATIGVMCHELGHLMLDLPDLYDTNGGSQGIGRWGLMGGGSWNQTGSYSGDSPSHISAWSKTMTGFTAPLDVDTEQTGVSLPSADGTPSAPRIWVDPYRAHEYFMLENRQQAGYDAGLPGHGLLIWHVDQRQRSNSDETHKLVDLEEADGLDQLDANNSNGDQGDPWPGSTDHTNFDDASTPDSKDYNSMSTQIEVKDISASMATMMADITPRAGQLWDHVRYDEAGPTTGAGLGSTTIWIGLRVTNDTGFSQLHGIDLYVTDSVAATLDVYYYESLGGGTPSNLLYSETGLAGVPGWNRLLLATPQSFPLNAHRGIVVKIVNDSGTSPASVDSRGTNSGRSYRDGDGEGTFLGLPFDLNLIALLGSEEDSPPTATTIVPSTTGPTNADTVSFDITFSKNVVNFNDAADLTIVHSGTGHTTVNVTGTGAAYSVDVGGITGDGSFALQVNTASDVEDDGGNPLASSVTSDAVMIDNTAPMVSIGAPSTGSTETGPVSYTVTYTGADAVTLMAGDVVLNQTGDANGTADVSGAGLGSRTVTITAISGTGTLGISIAADTASDTAGNSAAGAGPSATFTVSGSVTETIFDDSFE